MKRTEKKFFSEFEKIYIRLILLMFRFFYSLLPRFGSPPKGRFGAFGRDRFYIKTPSENLFFKDTF